MWVCYLGWGLFVIAAIFGLMVMVAAVSAQLELDDLAVKRQQRLDSQRETSNRID